MTTESHRPTAEDEVDNTPRPHKNIQYCSLPFEAHTHTSTAQNDRPRAEDEVDGALCRADPSLRVGDGAAVLHDVAKEEVERHALARSAPNGRNMRCGPIDGFRWGYWPQQ